MSITNALRGGVPADLAPTQPITNTVPNTNTSTNSVHYRGKQNAAAVYAVGLLTNASIAASNQIKANQSKSRITIIRTAEGHKCLLLMLCCGSRRTAEAQTGHHTPIRQYLAHTGRSISPLTNAGHRRSQPNQTKENKQCTAIDTDDGRVHCTATYALPHSRRQNSGRHRSGGGGGGGSETSPPPSTRPVNTHKHTQTHTNTMKIMLTRPQWPP